MKKNLLKIGVISSPFIFALVLLVSQAKAEPYGWSPDVDNSWKGPPSHVGPKLDKSPILLQPNHPLLPRTTESGAIRLFWHRVPGANGYHIYYGLSPRNYIFSAPNIGDTDNFTVRGLARRRYYFAVQAVQGYSVSDLSNEWWGTPGGGIYTGSTLGAATGFVPVQRTVVPTQVPEPTQEPAVQGVTDQIPPTVYQPPVYEPPVEQKPFVPQPTPTPLTFWQKLLRIFVK